MRSLAFGRQYEAYTRLLQCRVTNQMFESEYDMEELTEVADSVCYYMQNQHTSMYFYIVEAKLGNVRVGVHANPTAMCIELQAGQHFTVDLVASFPINSVDAPHFVSIFQRRNETAHAMDGWYKMSTDDALRDVATLFCEWT